jgi:hypothetical protein
MPRAAVKS